MKRYQFSAYSWQEVEEMDRANTPILIPLGSTEQEGTHLPLGVDTYVAEHLAHEAAKETNALAGPSLPVGYSEWFSQFPGTVSLKAETLLQVLREYTLSLIRDGFRKLIFVNGHGGNSPAVDIVARELVLNRKVQIAMVEVWKIANSLARNIPDLKENTFKHAGEIMTSIMLYLHPEMVALERAKIEYVKSNKEHFIAKSTLGPAEFQGIEIRLYDRAKNLTESGIMGDPTAATPQKGEVIFTRLKSYLIEMISHF
ncbi:MAG: creatininase family protein [Thermodesulfobacteriota bacterium]